jgi:hypothetical protein
MANSGKQEIKSTLAPTTKHQLNATYSWSELKGGLLLGANEGSICVFDPLNRSILADLNETGRAQIVIIFF